MGGSVSGLGAPPREALEFLERLLRKEGELAEGEEEPPESDFTRMLAQWLRYYGPVPPDFPGRVFGEAGTLADAAVADLVEGDRAVLDAISEEAVGPEICDAGNLEMLLRLMRRRSRPGFQALAAEKLPLFLAAWHGLAAPAAGQEGVQASLEKLFGYPAQAAAWESDLIPARVAGYQPAWMDALFRDTDLTWFGAGKEKLALAFPEDLELFLPSVTPKVPLESGPARVLDRLAAASPARLDLAALTAGSALSGDRLVEALWDLAWQGRISNDTFAAVRKGVETGFRPLPADPPREATFSRRARFGRWKASRPLAGAWLALNASVPSREPDPLEQEELAKDRARQLLRRHGLLFRELLAQELPPLQWGAVFRALRLMELSGEVLTGHFFSGIPGLQFLAPSGLRLLEAGLPGDAVYWMNAQDPASPCALGLEGLPYALPPRLASTHLVFHGAELVLVSRRLGRDLSLRVPPRHRWLPSYLGALRHLVERSFLPVMAVEVETINGEGALGSPYLEDFLDAGFEKGLRTVALRKRR